MDDVLGRLMILFKQYLEVMEQAVRCARIQTKMLKEANQEGLFNIVKKQEKILLQLAGLDCSQQELQVCLQRTFGLAAGMTLSDFLPFIHSEVRTGIEDFVACFNERVRELREINQNNRVLTLHALHLTDKVLSMLGATGREAVYQCRGEVPVKREAASLRLNKVV
ncbi:MAG: hypothetical protein C4589_02275 [Peptococcaceae bacterium]|nr:MAG: hypothetical protein C4589_02275 [Peptococcaceae bacterium]